VWRRGVISSFKCFLPAFTTRGVRGKGVGTLWADLTAEQRKQGSDASAQTAKQWLHRSASAADRRTAAAGRSEPSSSPTFGEDNNKVYYCTQFHRIDILFFSSQEVFCGETCVADPDPYGMFWGHLDPLVRDTDPAPDPSIIKQK
jgi:hypothetical protein